MTANPVLMMLRRYLMDNVEQSGRRRVEEVERRSPKVGLNNDKIYLLVCISSLSREIIETSLGMVLINLIASLMLL